MSRLEETANPQKWNRRRCLTWQYLLKVIRADHYDLRLPKFYDAQDAARLRVPACVQSISVRDTCRIVNANNDLGD